jgi:hypothetical protein
MQNLIKMSDQNEEQINLINYLVKTLTKNLDQKQFYNKNETNNLFLFEFFVFELYAPKEIITTIKQPYLALRFLNFPTLNLEGKLDTDRIIFNQGKTSFFEMDLNQLRKILNEEPLYVMLLDLNYGDIKILASSRLNISIFSFDNFLDYSGPPPPMRRNILKLFDNAHSKVAEFDISLLIRREYFKYDIETRNQQEMEIIDIHEKINTDTNIRLAQTVDNKKEEKKLSILKQESVNSEHASQRRDSKKSNLTKKENGVNTDYNIINKQVNKLISPNNSLNKDNISVKENQISQNVQRINNKSHQEINEKMLSFKENNPPPLFFYNKRQSEKQEIIVKVVNETPKTENKDFINQTNKIIEHVKLPNKNKKEFNILINNEPKENYEKKMKNVTRYISTEKNNKDDFVEEYKEDLRENEYLNLYSQLKNTENTQKPLKKINQTDEKTEKANEDAVKNNHRKKSINSISKKSSSISIREEDNIKYEKFYEVSNNNFEISATIKNHNHLIRSYNSLSVTNSAGIELKSNDANLKISGERQSARKKLKFENEITKTLESNSIKNSGLKDKTEIIEEEIYANYSKSGNKYGNNFSSKKAEETNEYNDFNYDDIPDESYLKEQKYKDITNYDYSEIQEEI